MGWSRWVQHCGCLGRRAQPPADARARTHVGSGAGVCARVSCLRVRLTRVYTQPPFVLLKFANRVCGGGGCREVLERLTTAGGGGVPPLDLLRVPLEPDFIVGKLELYKMKC